MLKKLLLASVVMSFAVQSVFAQTSDPGATSAAPAATGTPPAPTPGTDPNAFQRNVNQQNRVEQGLDSGQLSTGEAGRLEQGQSHIDQMERHDDNTGMTATEQQNLQNAQNRESQAIQRDDTNNINGNANSASSQRMQTDVQRDANQQQRVNQGVQSGNLTSGETANLERGQKNSDSAQARAASSGHVSAREQGKLQRRQNHQSGKIYRRKHNNRTTNTGATTP